MKKSLLSLIFLIITGILTTKAQKILSPSDFLGYELGTRFTNQYKVVDYFTYVSKTLNNVTLEKYGETNEFRPLYLSFISSEENINNLENIRKSNLKRAGILNDNLTSKVAIVWLSYNVHGNEASSTEAAMNTLYELVTNKQEWLKNTLVIIDPCLNPDGRDRYVNWYNQTKSTPYNTNVDAIEHNEPWPSGRPNHYLFDLNRDWMWATQIETQQRIAVYNNWLPQIHVDFHEQYFNSPYYFAPGAEPYHEIITNWQRNFQTAIGKNNAKHFDEKGWRYFTNESFDLLYPSYGDTYPTYMGAIGMTYEQAGHGKAGLGVITENNTILTLKDRIEHHTTTGLSTVEMASKNTTELIEEFEKFFDNSSLEIKSYILKGSKEHIQKVADLLKKHNIECIFPEKTTVKAYEYDSKTKKTIQLTGDDLVISTQQPKGKMVKVLFDENTKLTDSLTYDITAWNLAFAYGLKGYSSKTVIKGIKFKKNKPIINNEISKNTYAYICKWNEVSDAEFLGNLLQKGFNVRNSRSDFEVNGNSFSKGSLIIMRGENNHIPNFDELITTTANTLNKQLNTVSTGLVNKGSDFGSGNITLIKPKKVAVLAGEGISSLNFGEIWHFFETQLKYPLTIIKKTSLNKIDLFNYQVLILPEDYIANKKTLETLTNYTTNGGTLIVIGSSLKNFANKEGFLLKTKEDTLNTSKNKNANLISYNLKERESIKNMITGSVFKSVIDNTHPLAFGYGNFYYSLKLSGVSYNLLDNGLNINYFPKNTTNISGFAGFEASKKVPNSLLYGIEYKGKGQLIYMVDNPLFRSFWENGKLFFANAVFLN